DDSRTLRVATDRDRTGTVPILPAAGAGRRRCARLEQMRFTGHERDLWNTTSSNDDLDYMHARHYNPQLGRFLQIDPLAGSVSAPQSLNRYAYVLGNPLSYTDPTGMNQNSEMHCRQFPSNSNGDWYEEGWECWTVTGAPTPSPGEGPFDPNNGPGTPTGSPNPAPPTGGPEDPPEDPPIDCDDIPTIPTSSKDGNLAYADVYSNSLSVASTRRAYPPGLGTLAAMVKVATASVPWARWNTKLNQKGDVAVAAERYGNFMLGANLAASGAPRGLALRAGGIVNVIEAVGNWSFTDYSIAVAGLAGLGPRGRIFGEDTVRDFGNVQAGYDWYKRCAQ
ncbi:MAG: RHS repeat-associated core domain-containing protein, partial [Cutibacterium acnes]|nr:RHS repeat-associated core domain-containing protein [Cutibacterium acnes]